MKHVYGAFISRSKEHVTSPRLLMPTPVEAPQAYFWSGPIASNIARASWPSMSNDSFCFPGFGGFFSLRLPEYMRYAIVVEEDRKWTRTAATEYLYQRSRSVEVEVGPCAC